LSRSPIPNDRTPGAAGASSPAAAPAPAEPPDDALAVCSTSAAARLLGVSSTTVQIMVERGELRAWKTRGGHRRISLASLQALRDARVRAASGRDSRAPLVVLVVEDDPAQRRLYDATITGWALPVHLLLAVDTIDALLLAGRHRPDVLVTDLPTRPVDGLEMLRRLRARAEFDATALVIVSALDDAQIAARGGLPEGAVHYRKPIPFDTLRGFLEASALRKRRDGA
jgi:excisionase family DNA binding protein